MLPSLQTNLQKIVLCMSDNTFHCVAHCVPTFARLDRVLNHNGGFCVNCRDLDLLPNVESSGSS